MANTVNDNIIQAADIIADKKIARLQYDQTVIATITDTSTVEYGYYTVTDGSITFEAYSTNLSYRKDEQVYVLIPQNDFTQQKIIIGKYQAPNDDTTISTSSLFSKILVISDNLYENLEQQKLRTKFLEDIKTIIDQTTWGEELEDQENDDAETQQAKEEARNNMMNERMRQLTECEQKYRDDIENNTTYNNAFGIIANSQTDLENQETSTLIFSRSFDEEKNFLLQNNELFDKIGIRANFKCCLGLNYPTIYTGNYGLKVIFTYRNSANEIEQISDRFDTMDIFGNPYLLQDYSLQEKIIDISSLGNIISLDIYLFENGNFNAFNADLQASERIATEKENNIFINNLEIYFGLDLNNIDDNSFRLYPIYTEDYMQGKTIMPLWINKDQNNEYVGFSDGIYSLGDYQSINIAEFDQPVGREYQEANYNKWLEYINRSNKIDTTEIQKYGIADVHEILQTYAYGKDIEKALQNFYNSFNTDLTNHINQIKNYINNNGASILNMQTVIQQWDIQLNLLQSKWTTRMQYFKLRQDEINIIASAAKNSLDYDIIKEHMSQINSLTIQLYNIDQEIISIIGKKYFSYLVCPNGCNYDLDTPDTYLLSYNKRYGKRFSDMGIKKCKRYLRIPDKTSLLLNNYYNLLSNIDFTKTSYLGIGSNNALYNLGHPNNDDIESILSNVSELMTHVKQNTFNNLPGFNRLNDVDEDNKSFILYKIRETLRDMLSLRICMEDFELSLNNNIYSAYYHFIDLLNNKYLSSNTNNDWFHIIIIKNLLDKCDIAYKDIELIENNIDLTNNYLILKNSIKKLINYINNKYENENEVSLDFIDNIDEEEMSSELKAEIKNAFEYKSIKNTLFQQFLGEKIEDTYTPTYFNNDDPNNNTSVIVGFYGQLLSALTNKKSEIYKKIEQYAKTCDNLLMSFEKRLITLFDYIYYSHVETNTITENEEIVIEEIDFDNISNINLMDQSFDIINTINWQLCSFQKQFNYLVNDADKTKRIIPFTEKKDLFTNEFKNRYSIYWYRYNPEETKINEKINQYANFLGNEWQLINKTNEGLPAQEEYRLSENENDSNYYWQTNINQPAVYIDFSLYNNIEEKIQAVIIYNHNIYTSNILTFTNANGEQESEIALLVQDEQNKYINLYGQTPIYKIYDSSNLLIDISNNSLSKKIKAISNLDVDLISNDDITNVIVWQVPINSTILSINETLLTQKGFSKYIFNNDNIIHINTDNLITYNDISNLIKITGYDDDENNYVTFYKIIKAESDCEFFYSYSSIYSPLYINNTIKCNIIGFNNSIELTPMEMATGSRSELYRYSNSQSFNFTTTGTNGTEYTLSVVPDLTNLQTAVTSHSPLRLKVAVVDPNGEILKLETSTVHAAWKYNYASESGHNFEIEENTDNLDESGYKEIIISETGLVAPFNATNLKDLLDKQLKDGVDLSKECFDISDYKELEFSDGYYLVCFSHSNLSGTNAQHRNYPYTMDKCFHGELYDSQDYLIFPELELKNNVSVNYYYLDNIQWDYSYPIQVVHLYHGEDEEIDPEVYTHPSHADIEITKGAINLKTQIFPNDTLLTKEQVYTFKYDPDHLSSNWIHKCFMASYDTSGFDYHLLQINATITIDIETDDNFSSEPLNEDELSNLLTANTSSSSVKTKTLTVYYPIAWSNSTEDMPYGYSYSGPQTILYDQSGTNPMYNSNIIQLLNTNQNLIELGNDEYLEYELVSFSTANRQLDNAALGAPALYPPARKTDVYLQASKVYLSGDDLLSTIIVKKVSKNNKDYIQQQELFHQPLYIDLNRYSCRLFNDWNGELIVDKKNNLIAAATIMAGIKEADNTFSGTFIGNIEKQNGIQQDDQPQIQGIYGYNHGEQAFGFRNDGTAFIGKMGHGRIEFDGNQGIIRNGSYIIENEQASMEFIRDLIGIGDITNYTSNLNNNAYSSSESEETSFLNANFYKAAGMKIDLDDGLIDIRGLQLRDEEEFKTNLFAQATNQLLTDEILNSLDYRSKYEYLEDLINNNKMRTLDIIHLFENNTNYLYWERSYTPLYKYEKALMEYRESKKPTVTVKENAEKKITEIDKLAKEVISYYNLTDDYYDVAHVYWQNGSSSSNAVTGYYIYNSFDCIGTQQNRQTNKKIKIYKQEYSYLSLSNGYSYYEIIPANIPSGKKDGIQYIENLLKPLLLNLSDSDKKEIYNLYKMKYNIFMLDYYVNELHKYNTNYSNFNASTDYLLDDGTMSDSDENGKKIYDGGSKARDQFRKSKILKLFEAAELAKGKQNYLILNKPSGANIRISAKEPYFYISVSKPIFSQAEAFQETPLIYISKNKYYLQSENYIENTSGVKFDLSGGQLLAHDFKLQAGNQSVLENDSPGVYLDLNSSGTFLLYTSNDEQYVHISNTSPFLSVGLVQDQVYLVRDPIADDTLVEQKIVWRKDYLRINSKAGWLTSYNFQMPLMPGLNENKIYYPESFLDVINWDTTLAYPAQGLLIDLKNAKIILGNDAEIRGVNTSFINSHFGTPSYVLNHHRQFRISNGATTATTSINGHTVPYSRSNASTADDYGFFILAETCYANSDYQPLFRVGWDGSVKYKSASQFSSKTIKKNITTNLDSTLLQQLQPVRFQYKDSNNNYFYGFIAEDVQQILPDVVRMDPDNPKKISGLDYNSIFTLAIAEIQQLRKELNELKEIKEDKI